MENLNLLARDVERRTSNVSSARAIVVEGGYEDLLLQNHIPSTRAPLIGELRSYPWLCLKLCGTLTHCSVLALLTLAATVQEP